MQKLFSLGQLYVSDFLSPGQEPGQKHELEMVMDESIGAARLKTTVPVTSMFGKYWYRSGTNQSMKDALKDIVDSITPLFKKNVGRWLDIACNDGTLLRAVPGNFSKFGIDPCEDDIYESAKMGNETGGQVIIKNYFSALALYRARVFPKPFDVVTSIAMFYDLEDPDEFIKDVYEVLDDEGLWVLQLSYTPLMIKQLAFDNILSEHVFYHSLSSIRNLMERNGMTVVDCTLNEVNGGSMRVFVRKEKANPKNFGTQAYRDVCAYRVESLLEKESWIDQDTWLGFYDDVLTLKSQVVEFITHAKGRGKTIMGYGASTKGNTLLQFFGLDNTLIDAIAERQECKWGLRTVGSNIPIISEDEMRKANPDYLLMLPWHFSDSFIEREKEWHSKGNHWIIPCPKFEIV